MTEAGTFIDTNILVYAFDKTEPKKHKIAKQIIEKTWKKEATYFISNQVLGEFSRALTQKINNPLTPEECHEILQTFKIKEWITASYSLQTILYALKLMHKNKTSFWDSLIMATMIENSIYKIYTEDEGFKKINEIETINPFK